MPGGLSVRRLLCVGFRLSAPQSYVSRRLKSIPADVASVRDATYDLSANTRRPASLNASII